MSHWLLNSSKHICDRITRQYTKIIHFFHVTEYGGFVDVPRRKTPFARGDFLNYRGL